MEHHILNIHVQNRFDESIDFCNKNRTHQWAIQYIQAAKIQQLKIYMNKGKM